MNELCKICSKDLQEYESNDIYINNSNLLLPAKKTKVIEKVLFTIIIIISVFYLSIMFFIFSTILYLVIYTVLGKTGVILIPQVKYHCPKCNFVFDVTISKQQKKYLVNNENFKCKCEKCKFQYNLHVSKDVLSHF